MPPAQLNPASRPRSRPSCCARWRRTRRGASRRRRVHRRARGRARRAPTRRDRRRRADAGRAVRRGASDRAAALVAVAAGRCSRSPAIARRRLPAAARRSRSTVPDVVGERSATRGADVLHEPRLRGRHRQRVAAPTTCPRPRRRAGPAAGRAGRRGLDGHAHRLRRPGRGAGARRHGPDAARRRAGAQGRGLQGRRRSRRTPTRVPTGRVIAVPPERRARCREGQHGHADGLARARPGHGARTSSGKTRGRGAQTSSRSAGPRRSRSTEQETTAADRAPCSSRIPAAGTQVRQGRARSSSSWPRRRRGRRCPTSRPAIHRGRRAPGAAQDAGFKVRTQRRAGRPRPTQDGIVSTRTPRGRATSVDRRARR